MPSFTPSAWTASRTCLVTSTISSRRLVWTWNSRKAGHDLVHVLPVRPRPIDPPAARTFRVRGLRGAHVGRHPVGDLRRVPELQLQVARSEERRVGKEWRT